MADCSDCGKTNAVPYIAHERDMARMDRINRRLIALCIILAILLCGSWIGFMAYESQFETVEKTEQIVDQYAEGDGNNQFVGGDYNGQ